MITLPPPPPTKIGPLPRGYMFLPAHLQENTVVMPHDRYWSNQLGTWVISHFIGKHIPSQHRLAPDVYIRRKQDLKVQAGSIIIKEI